MNTGIVKTNPKNRRTTEAPISSGWKCHYCNKVYTHEKSFMKHQCEKKKRLDEIKTPIGQAAYANYGDWMKLKGRSVPAIDTFTTSRMYNSFLKFTMYSQKLNITSSVFIKLMVDLDIESVIWCRDNTYSIYLEHYDKFHDPGEQVVNTLEFLKVLAEKENVVINQIFNHLGFMRFLEYVRLRKISPWVIFNSTSCTNFFKNLDQEDLGVLSGILNFKVWADRLGKNKDDCLLLQELIGEYGL